MDMKKNFQIAIKELVGEVSPAKNEKAEKPAEAPKPETGQSAIERLRAEKARQTELKAKTKEVPKAEANPEPKEALRSEAKEEPKTYKEIQEASAKAYRDFQSQPVQPVTEPLAQAILTPNAIGTPYNDFSEREDKDMTIISEGTSIQGNITTDGGIKIYGNVAGDIKSQGKVCVYGEVHGDISGERVELLSCRMQGNISALDSVIVSQETKIVGDVTANTLRSEGKLKGNVVVQNGAELSSNAVLLGNLTSAEILIEKGAVIRGEIKVVMNSDTEELGTEEGAVTAKTASLDDFDR